MIKMNVRTQKMYLLYGSDLTGGENSGAKVKFLSGQKVDFKSTLKKTAINDNAICDLM